MTTSVFYVIVWNDGDRYFGMCPDFSVMSSDQSSESDVMVQVQTLIATSVSQAKLLGQELPTPTTLGVLQSKWGSPSYKFLSVSVTM